MKNKTVVVALGGNALGKGLSEQREAVRYTAKIIVDLEEMEYDIVVTHGNGPQVGWIQSAMDTYARMQDGNFEVPLSTSVAMSQGYIGIDLQNAIKYELHRRNIDRKVSTILSQVQVDENDPAFLNPSKPIGSFMTRDEAEGLMAKGICCMEDAGRGWRKCVASPEPVRIRELKTLMTLLEAGHIVITCGGGGIPVADHDGMLDGIDAVIDKDKSSALLAAQIKADRLLILTAVEKVAVHFGTPDQKDLDHITTDEALKLMEEGHFGKGSMLPKIQAAVRYVQAVRGCEAIITRMDLAGKALEGLTGTRITT